MHQVHTLPQAQVQLTASLSSVQMPNQHHQERKRKPTQQSKPPKPKRTRRKISHPTLRASTAQVDRDVLAASGGGDGNKS